MVLERFVQCPERPGEVAEGRREEASAPRSRGGSEGAVEGSPLHLELPDERLGSFQNSDTHEGLNEIGEAREGAGLADAHLVEDRRYGIQVLHRIGVATSGELEEAENGPVLKLREATTLGQRLGQPGERVVFGVLDSPSQRCDSRSRGENLVAALDIAGVEDDVTGLVRVSCRQLPVPGNAFRLGEGKERVEPMQLQALVAELTVDLEEELAGFIDSTGPEHLSPEGDAADPSLPGVGPSVDRHGSLHALAGIEPHEAFCVASRGERHAERPRFAEEGDRHAGMFECGCEVAAEQVGPREIHVDVPDELLELAAPPPARPEAAFGPG